MNQPLIYYGPRSGWCPIRPREIWRFRQMIWAFGLRDIKVRYRPAVVGALWAIIQPLFTVLVFGVLISFMQGNATSGTVPYLVTGLCGIVPWQFFSSAISHATASVASNAHLLKKVYFPRTVLPIASAAPPLLDFLIAMSLLGIVMLASGVVPGWRITLLPLLFLATLLTVFAFGFWLAALNGLYRDFQFALPFCLQLGIFVSPVFYEVDAVVPERWQALYYINPVAGLIQCYRAILLNQDFPNAVSLLISAGAITLIGLSGLAFFQRMERRFADVA